jgi:hypothetical protein
MYRSKFYLPGRPGSPASPGGPGKPGTNKEKNECLFIGYSKKRAYIQYDLEDHYFRVVLYKKYLLF